MGSSGKDTTWCNRGAVTYDELKPYTEAPSGKITIIDVREPSEVAQGMIPAAVNVPLSVFGDAFDPNNAKPAGADFERNFSFPRPAFDDQLIFYCRSGRRSQQAMDIARKRGWWKYVRDANAAPAITRARGPTGCRRRAATSRISR